MNLKSFDGKKIGNNMISIKYVGASWCKPCKIVKPDVEKLCERFKVSLIILDYDDDLSEKEQSEIIKLPSIFIYDESGLVKTIISNHIEQLTEFLTCAFGITKDEDF